MEQKQHIDEIIARSIGGTISDQEQQILERWLQIPENRILYSELQQVHAMLPTKYFLSSDMKQADWQDISPQFRNTHAAKWYLAAASIAAFFVLGFASWFLLNNDHEMLSFETGAFSKEFVLPDSSVVTLNHHSKLSLHADFNQNSRNVTLEGEGFFEIHRDTSRPFEIKTNEVTTRVLGTSFNLLNEDHRVLLDVVSGKVSFSEGTQELLLTKNQSAAFEQGHLENRTNDPNHYSWKTGILTFRDTPLEQALAQIANHYRISVDTSQLGMTDLTITTVWDHEQLQNVWKELKLMLPIQIKKDNKRYIISTN